MSCSRFVPPVFPSSLPLLLLKTFALILCGGWWVLVETGKGL